MLSCRQYDESKGKMPVFSWTYNGYSKGLQPAKQDTMITPLSRTERPDQASITFMPPKCTQADESSARTYSSSHSVTEDKTSKGSFNIGIEIPIKMATVGASYKRGWSDSLKTYQKFTEEGETTMTKMEAISEMGLHWRIRNVSFLTSDFVLAVEELDEWLNLTRWKVKGEGGKPALCSGEGENLDTCAYKGYNTLLRSFVNTFGTDYMNDATFGGKMTIFKAFSTRAAASVKRKEVSKSTEESWTASVKLMSPADALKEKADMSKNAAIISGNGADKEQIKEWKAGKAAKVAAQKEIAQEEAKATLLAKANQAKADAAAAAAAAAAADAPEGRRLLQSPRRFISGGASNSQSSSETREQAESASDALSNSVMKFYGCTPSRDPIAWCNSCAASPVAIEYSMAPLSTLISQVLDLPELAKRLETYIEDEYQIGCLPGYTWNKANGECDKDLKCPKGTTVALGEPLTQTTSSDVPEDGACICDCLGTTHPDLARTFVLSIDGQKITNESGVVPNETSVSLCRSDYAEYSQCRDGRVYNCRISTMKSAKAQRLLEQQQIDAATDAVTNPQSPEQQRLIALLDGELTVTIKQPDEDVQGRPTCRQVSIKTSDIISSQRKHLISSDQAHIKSTSSICRNVDQLKCSDDDAELPLKWPATSECYAGRITLPEGVCAEGIHQSGDWEEGVCTGGQSIFTKCGPTEGDYDFWAEQGQNRVCMFNFYRDTNKTAIYYPTNTPVADYEPIYSSVSIKSEVCNETIKSKKRSTLYNCQSQSCSINRQCEAETAIEGKGLKESCGCPIEFEYQHCRADNTWFSCGNPGCTQSYPAADANNTRCNSTEFKKVNTSASQSSAAGWLNDCWCGEESSKWRQCDSDKSWFLKGQTKNLYVNSTDPMERECIGKRMCHSDNSLFENACPTQGFPCSSLTGNAALSLEDQDQNQMCFAAGTGSLTTFTCANCEPGKFSSVENSQRCDDCPVGKYTDTAGATECTPCQPGFAGQNCNDEIIPYNAEVKMRNDNRDAEATSLPCQYKGGTYDYKGCWNADSGPLKGELKHGNECDITQVALPKGVGIKMYSFTRMRCADWHPQFLNDLIGWRAGGGLDWIGEVLQSIHDPCRRYEWPHWPEGVGLGAKGPNACCESNSTAVDPETCSTEPDDNGVRFLGKFEPTPDADRAIPRPWQDRTNCIGPECETAVTGRRLLGSGQGTRTGACMYNLYIMEGYTCAAGPPGKE